MLCPDDAEKVAILWVLQFHVFGGDGASDTGSVGLGSRHHAADSSQQEHNVASIRFSPESLNFGQMFVLCAVFGPHYFLPLLSSLSPLVASCELEYSIEELQSFFFGGGVHCSGLTEPAVLSFKVYSMAGNDDKFRLYSVRTDSIVFEPELVDEVLPISPKTE